MFSISPKLFPLCIVLAIGPPATVVALNYHQWFAPKPIYPWLAQGEVLFFNAPWCGACKAMKPTVAKLQDEGFDIRSVDVNKHQQQAMKYGIGSIPTFVLVRDGQEVRRSVGCMSPDDLKQIWR